MKIHVRRRHIRDGKRESSLACPIALAIAEVVEDDPIVQPWSVMLGGTTLDLPMSAHDFIARFDAGKPVKPFAFVLK